MYELSFTLPYPIESEVRGLLGVDSTELTDDDINSLVILGAAELEILTTLPLFGTLVEDPTTPKLAVNRMILAFCCVCAFFAFDSLKLRLLESEDDNKSKAKRSSKMFDTDPNTFMLRYKQYLRDAEVLIAPADVVQLELFSPSIDIITGR